MFETHKVGGDKMVNIDIMDINPWLGGGVQLTPSLNAKLS